LITSERCNQLVKFIFANRATKYHISNGFSISISFLCLMTNRTTPHVVAVCGSLRDESRTRIATNVALASADKAGATTEFVDLRSYNLPSLNAVDTEIPDAEALRKTIVEADSVLLGTPNYHGSYSGSLKNALDYCGRDEFEGKTVGLLEVAAGEFPGSALTHLRTVTRTLRAWTLPTEVAIPNSHALITDDGISDSEIAERTRRLGQELADYAGVSNHPQPNQQSAIQSTDCEADD
jgi:NAD(P)H-dependent FMN reductase